MFTFKNIENNSFIISYRNRVLFALLIILLLLFHNYISFFPYAVREGKCNIDTMFILTESINKYMLSNDNARKFLQIISSFLIDLSVICMVYSWILYSRTWRLLITVGLFYAFRGVCNVIFLMRYPDNLIWGYPGFPSATVSYHMTSDFFFSGHVGINLIAALELKRFKLYKLSIVSFMGIFIQLLLMFSVRGHYSLDLAAGLISAHYFSIIGFKLAPYLDNFWNIDHNMEGFLSTRTTLVDLHSEFEETQSN